MATKEVDALRANTLFEALPFETIEHLAASSARLSLDEGEPLLGAEQIQNYDVYVLLEGRLSVSKIGSPKTNTILGEIGPGGLFGEFAAISGRPGWASAKAAVPTIVIKIPRSEFLGLLRDYPEVTLRLLQNLIGLIHNLDDRIVALSAVDNAVEDTLKRLFLSTI